MVFTKGNPGAYAFKPKYTGEDMEQIKADLEANLPVETIYKNIADKHPDVSPISIFRWIWKATKEIK